MTGARSTAYANAQAFPTDSANCKDSICNDPKLILGSYVKGPNNKICREWVERLGFGHRTVVSHGVHGGRTEVKLVYPGTLSIELNVLILSFTFWVLWFQPPFLAHKPLHYINLLS